MDNVLFRDWNDFADTLGDYDTGLPPAELSHYCDLPALLSILQKGLLWASNIRFLNDKEEMEFGIKVAVSLIKQTMVNTGQNPATFNASNFDPNQIPDVYAVSFCESADLLSMWRGYGLGSQSVSIQFDFRALAHIAEDESFVLSDVTYGYTDALNDMRDMLSTTSAKFAFTSEVDHKAVLQLCPQYKNEHFREEQEWRLISRSGPKNVCYRTRNNVLMPYVEVNGILDAISSITIGPGKDSELTKRSIEHFLKSNYKLAHIKVVLSEIPYRT